MMVELAYNPLRLTSPLRRVNGAKGDPGSTFEPISWDEALDIIARKFLALRDSGEARAIANRTTGRMPRGTGSLVHRLFTLLGSPNDTDVGPVCNDAGGDALAATFGLGNFTNGYGVDEATGREDLGAARYLLMFGTNQAETHPVTFAYLLRSRGHCCVEPSRLISAANLPGGDPIKPCEGRPTAYQTPEMSAYACVEPRLVLIFAGFLTVADLRDRLTQQSR
jgi:anaerobic selenocysteine-containing dehydrogenase